MSGSDEQHEGPALSNAVDFKTLFMGACALIAVLGGNLVSRWDHSTQQQAERNEQQAQQNRDSNQRQWSKLSDLERQLFLYQGRLESVEKLADELKQQVRELERSERQRR